MSTPHHSIALGKGLIAIKPYQFVTNGGNGTQLVTTMTPEEYECIATVVRRLVSCPVLSRSAQYNIRKKCQRCGKHSVTPYCDPCRQFRKERRISRETHKNHG